MRRLNSRHLLMNLEQKEKVKEYWEFEKVKEYLVIIINIIFVQLILLSAS